MQEKFAYTVKEFSKKTGLSKNTVYRALQSGEIKSVKVRGRILIPAWALEVLLGMKVSATKEGDLTTKNNEKGKFGIISDIYERNGQ